MTAEAYALLIVHLESGGDIDKLNITLQERARLMKLLAIYRQRIANEDKYPYGKTIVKGRTL
jgi:hypothetical protein